MVDKYIITNSIHNFNTFKMNFGSPTAFAKSGNNNKVSLLNVVNKNENDKTLSKDVNPAIEVIL